MFILYIRKHQLCIYCTSSKCMWSFPLHNKLGSTSCLGGHFSVKDHEGLWLHLTCELMRQMLLTVSRILAEDMKFWVRDKGWGITQSSERGRGSVFLTSLCPSSQGDRECLGDTYTCSQPPFGGETRPWGLESSKVGREYACSLFWRERLSLSSSTIHSTNISTKTIWN